MVKNQKGFLLAEALIVSTFVISVLIFLFIQFKNLSTSYSDSFKYNRVDSLYALDNIKTYLKENSSSDKKISDSLTSSGKTYIYIYNNGSCNPDLGLRGTGYCEELMEKQGLKTVIFTKSKIADDPDDVTDDSEVFLKTELRTKANPFSENMKNFILRTSVKELKHTYRLIGEFEDGSFATFNVGDEDWNSAKYNDPDYVDPSYNNNLTSTSCFTTASKDSGLEITGYTCSNTTVKVPSEINGKRVISIGANAFKNKSLTSATIPPGVKYIEDSAFLGNNLTSFSIPESVTRIGTSAFANNKIAGNLIIPDSVSTIYSSAFANNKITSVTLGNVVSSIGDSAFLNNSISKISFNNFLYTIGNNAFAENKLSNTSSGGSVFTVPNGVTQIGTSAFQNNSITKVSIPESVSTIGSYAFKEKEVTSGVNPWEDIEINGENEYRFNATWAEIGWPLSKISASKSFAMTNGSATYEIDLDGYYKIDLWGAEGGYAICNSKTYSTDSSCAKGGKGAYTSGIAYFEAGKKLYVYVGGKAENTEIPSSSTISSKGGFNGGGNGTWDSNTDEETPEAAGGGGGATDIRYEGTGLENRIMVAGGGGGASWTSTGGYGGDLWGGSELALYSNYPVTKATPGKQATGNALGTGASGSGAGDSNGVAGGGGGYYGGKTNTSTSSGENNSGAGGSSFISGYAGVNALNSSKAHTKNTIHYSGIYFMSAKMINGASSMPDTSLEKTETGHSGDGSARITYLGNAKPTLSSSLKNVRYIKDCVNGSSKNNYNHWTEIQAIADGKNVAKGKTPSGTSTLKNNNDESKSTYITDGVIDDHTLWTQSSTTGSEQCVTIDLGAKYNLEEIAVWHYFGDGRYYKSHTVYAGTTKSSLRKIYFSSGSTSTSENTNGIRIK